MIGVEYKGSVHYVTRLDDFRELMEPSVYEALEEMVSSGYPDANEYEELETEYNELLAEHEALEEEYEELEDAAMELDKCKDKLLEAKEKLDGAKKSIKRIVDDVYLGYISNEEALHKLEQIASGNND